ncbi:MULTISPECIES: fumarylacetoacetate hydrolase family protein [unclassified Methylobacterium]|uniref:fumarylacetoacetate hydrolase family protein n=1 Tax=unclassified Methylobacterium TaxID=2615210 RepID=UPI000CB7AB53|nr:MULTISPECIES: fumarylacetoacetate hydrolase family protein [unclassified Methylobacterium]PIU04441.1 MAG: 2-hydroxyhepta-2,4-diene-1,7-dioate isomerase [Methylobacterium sp. CG09_land_8_20_14_0_10_71_15]PIU13762.1 MAG: 2-hydroxyhepta-2,4-diene-1,7-dioate isomerase [Methylobacterium sp. CG08_land_8_20_14_0_20_71_15]GBU17097.1 2-hydroxyhepta-2,4-diene-1,7-dioate isomerase [Methylobacterium sp.]
MKLIRHGASGDEKPGLVDGRGIRRDLSAILRDIAGPALSRESLDRLRRIDPESLPVVPEDRRLGPCVGGTRNVVAVGLNYSDHAEEAGLPVPAEPILFSKAPSCLCGPDDAVIIPKGSNRTDWEVELAIVIGARASYVHANEALDYVAGLTICNDVSEREWQFDRGGTWSKGKGCPTFGPLGPWLVTLDEIPDPKALNLWLDLNGERMQSGSTGRMIFDLAQLVAYVSHFMMLEPGDIITTGTPPGVGMARKPPRYLRSGDEMRLGIDSLGEQRQRVVAFDDWTAKVSAGEPTN